MKEPVKVQQPDGSVEEYEVELTASTQQDLQRLQLALHYGNRAQRRARAKQARKKGKGRK